MLLIYVNLDLITLHSVTVGRFDLLFTGVGYVYIIYGVVVVHLFIRLRSV